MKSQNNIEGYIYLNKDIEKMQPCKEIEVI